MKACREHEMYQTISPIAEKVCQYELNSKAISYSHYFGAALR